MIFDLKFAGSKQTCVGNCVLRSLLAVIAMVAASGIVCGQSANLDAPLQQAEAAQRRGDDTGAVNQVDLYRKLLQAHPEAVVQVEAAANANGYLTAGEMRFAMSQFDMARRDADSAARLSAKLPGLATLQGMILERTADYDGAEAALLRAIAENARDYNAHFYLGAIYYFRREMTKARVQLTQALALAPQAAQARYELALVAQAQGKNDEACRNLETVVSAMPDWMEPHVELSALYYKLHRPEDGVREREIVDRMMAALQERQAQAAR